jgi:subtilisin family serine protease
MNLHKASLFFLLLTYACRAHATSEDGEKKLKNYIITFEAKEGVNIDNQVPKEYEAWHKSILSTITKDNGTSRHIYSYNRVANGFAAKLTDEEAQAMKDYPGCVRVTPANKPLQLMTTHSPDFLGLRGSEGLWRRMKNMGEGIIIGVLDSGISPGHPSFDDKGMPPPPAKWKGHCDFNTTVCNNKLIGAKTMLKAGADEKKHMPPYDFTGHGTHTASTAAGSFVNNISVLGISMGEASGVAPRAHLAIYKVCDDQLGCQIPDVLKGFEEAVKDGCDVLSVSLANDAQPIPFYQDPIAVASFYAILNGVIVSAGAGNSGPKPSTIANGAPWLLTVAASSTDRQIRSTVKLGNELELDGESLYQPKNWTSKMLPLVYLVGNDINPNASHCLNGSLDKNLVTGKIVVCDYGLILPTQQGAIVQEAGGVGMITANIEMAFYHTQAFKHVIPASHVSYVDGVKIKDYIQSTPNPVATFIFKGPVYHDNFSSSITVMSSRGPSSLRPLTLKPDISGPGVSILAAVPPNLLSTRVLGNDKFKSFGLMTGTSMATPHLSGTAALIKKAHPDWSPSAIRSSIMTTARITNSDGKPIVDHTHINPANVFDMGAGHVDPSKALDPGLVYDIDSKDYISYLCGLGFEEADVNNIIFPASHVKCEKVKVISEEQLNNPSIAASLKGNNTTKIIYRTVTNVGKVKQTTYEATITVPNWVSVKVVPSTLEFKDFNEKKTFQIIFERRSGSAAHAMPFGFGELKWASGRYVVRSPIVVYN